MEELDLLDYQEAVQTELQKSFKDDFLLFARSLIIPSAQGRRLFDHCIQPFQVEFFESIAPSLYAVRDGTMPPIRRFWVERTKKSAKDSDIVVCLLWLMIYHERPFKGQVCAANNRQARIAENRAVELVHYNPWLRDRVEIVQNFIRNREFPREVWFHIESTGKPGEAQGEAPEFLWLNEVTHADCHWAVMEAHMNNANGVPQGVAVVSTNAGIKGTKAEVWRNNAIANRERWCVYILKGQAPWISKEDVEEARRLDPIGAEFRRLWKGEWVSGIGDAVSEAAIDRCFQLKGPTRKPKTGWLYVAGLDLGISKDHCGVVLLGANERLQQIKVCRVKAFIPSIPNDKGVLEVDFEAVERYCEKVGMIFHLRWFGYDPAAGGSAMAQRLRRRGIPMREMTFSSPSNQTLMATAFVTAMNDGRLLCYEDSEGRLRRDFGKFNIEHKPPSGYKLVATRDQHGHADVGVALVICLPEAIRMLGLSLFGPGDDLTVTGEQEEFQQEDVDQLPAELRDIYEGEGEELDEGVHTRKRMFGKEWDG